MIAVLGALLALLGLLGICNLAITGHFLPTRRAQDNSHHSPRRLTRPHLRAFVTGTGCFGAGVVAFRMSHVLRMFVLVFVVVIALSLFLVVTRKLLRR